MSDTFQNKGIDKIKERITVETFCGSKILRVDDQRIGHAMDDGRVEDYRHYLATALPDLERLFQEEV
jgi:hypothetical protein